MASNTASALPWEKLRDELNARLCSQCGSALRSWTYHGDHGISGFGKREAPVDFECAADPVFHNWREWIEIPA